MKQPRSGVMPRRQMLGLLGGAGLTAVASACSVQTQAPSSGASVPPITLPDPQVSLPTEKLTFRWIDTGARKALFQKPWFAAYQEKHPNITIQYDGTGYDQVNEVVPLGIRNNSAPDVFAMPSNVPAATAVEQGWVQPIDDLIPDFASWRAAFPDGSFRQNSEIFGDKTYTFPLTGTKQVSDLMVYDIAYLEDAGISPSDFSTWDGMRQAAKKLTQKGSGNYFGMMGSQSNTSLVHGLANAAGWYTVDGGMDMHIGEYIYHADEMVQAVEMVLAMQSDGSLFPDSASLSPLDAISRMPSRPAALIAAGPFYFPQWDQAAPDWNWALQQMPTPEAGQSYYVHYSSAGENNAWVYAKTKYPTVAADLLSYRGSLEGQIQLAIQTKGYLVPIMPEAIEQAKTRGSLAPHAKMATEAADTLCRLQPDPQIRNADISEVATKVNAVHPSFTDVLAGMFSGQIKDIKSEFHKLDDRLNKNLDTAIEKARKAGAKVSRDDYVFPNWKPSENYSQADYAKL